MPFHSGRVSFARFQVQGDAPQAVDETTLATLSEYAFHESSIGAPDEIEAGFVTGEHLFDVQFSYEKNGYGTPGEPMLLFAIRIDTNKPPAEIKRAYKRMNEQALLEQSASGFLSKNEKREAADLASRQVSEELAAGRYRRSKMIQLLWDLKRQTLYCGNTSSAVAEQVSSLFHSAFNLQLTAMSAGTLAGKTLIDQGRTRDYEDILPTAFTAPPPEATIDHEDAEGPKDLNVPYVPWTTNATDLKDFLGNEFLVWLWWLGETKEGIVTAKGLAGAEQEVSILLDRTLDMDCAWDTRGRMGLRASGPTRLPEAAEALAHGKWPRRVGLTIAGPSGEPYEFSLQAERLEISGAQLPAIDDAQTPRDLLEQRLEHMRSLANLLDAMFTAFVDARCSERWTSQRQSIREWVRGRRRGGAAARDAAKQEPAVEVGEIPETGEVIDDARDTMRRADEMAEA